MIERSRNLALRIFITLVLICFFAAPVWSTADSDTTAVYEKPRSRKGAVEYIFWPVSTTLKLPSFVLSHVVSQPVKLVERHSLLPALQKWMIFAVQWGVYPVADYKSTTGLVGGMGFHRRHLFAGGIGLKVKGTYSTNMYRLAYVRVGGQNWGGGPFGLTGQIGWQAETRERFYGIGPGSDIDDEVNYGSRGISGNLTGSWLVARGLNAEGFVAMRDVRPEDGRLTTIYYRRDSIDSLFADQKLYGLFEELDLTEYGLGMEFDRRQRPGSPLGGGVGNLRVSYVTGDGADETEIGFWKVRAEAQYYVNLFRGRVIGVRILAERTDPDEGTRVPFYCLARLGGNESLRGYDGGRFTDRDLVSLTAEYRWPLWRKLDAFIFTDQGRVFRNIKDDFEFSDFRSSYGFGLRLWRQNGSSGITFARSAEAFKFYFHLGS